jgi:hypothetical protein
MKEGRLEATSVLDLKEVLDNVRGVSGKDNSRRSLEMLSVEDLLDCLAEETEELRSSRARPDQVSAVLIDSLGLGAESKFAKAAAKVCALISDDPNAPSYHNPQHVTEVVIAAYCLGLREHLPKERVAELVIAAIAHDLGHTGGVNSFAFELETASFEYVEPHLIEAGLDEEEIERARQMILSTDFKEGAPLARTFYEKRRRLQMSHQERMIASQCELLVEADVLFSCFNENYNSRLSDLLAVEWDLPEAMSYDQRIGFLKSVQFISDAAIKLHLDDRRKNLIASLEKQRGG